MKTDIKTPWNEQRMNKRRYQINYYYFRFFYIQLIIDCRFAPSRSSFAWTTMAAMFFFNPLSTSFLMLSRIFRIKSPNVPTLLFFSAVAVVMNYFFITFLGTCIHPATLIVNKLFSNSPMIACWRVFTRWTLVGFLILLGTSLARQSGYAGLYVQSLDIVNQQLPRHAKSSDAAKEYRRLHIDFCNKTYRFYNSIKRQVHSIVDD